MKALAYIFLPALLLAFGVWGAARGVNGEPGAGGGAPQSRPRPDDTRLLSDPPPDVTPDVTVVPASSYDGRDRDQPPPSSGPRFEAVGVYIDSSDRPLAAYQIQISATAGDVALVGIEGGAHPAFKPPPHYDPRALLEKKVIVAAFSTAADLPRGRTRVATLMVRVSGPVRPAYDASLQIAAAADGSPVDAKVILSPVAEGATP